MDQRLQSAPSRRPGTKRSGEIWPRLGDQRLVPCRRILPVERHHHPSGIHPRWPPRLGEAYRGRQRQHLGFVRRQRGERGGDAQHLPRIARMPAAAAAILMRLGVSDLDRAQHGVEPVGPGVGAGHLEGALRRRAILFFARTSRCASVGSGSRNARAISGVERPQTSLSVSAARASGMDRRMAADEDQLEPLVGDQPGVGHCFLFRAGRRLGIGQRGARSCRAPPHHVERGTVGDAVEPCRRIARCFGRPGRHRPGAGLGERFLRRYRDRGTGPRARHALARRDRARPDPARDSIGPAEQRPDLDRSVGIDRELLRDGDRRI